MPYSEVQLKYFRAAEWRNSNVILTRGEPGYESDTGKMKIGDGGTRWNRLPYFNTSSPVSTTALLFQSDFVNRILRPYENSSIASITLGRGLAYSAGNSVVITNREDPATGFEAIISEYSSSTGRATLTRITSIRGSSYYEPLHPSRGTNWSINLSGQRGTVWFAKNTAPTSATTQYRVGDFVIDKSTGDLWYRSS